jgi:hypothetical protein
MAKCTNTTRFLDLLGGALVAASLGAAGWLAVFGAAETKARVTELSGQVQEAKQSIAGFRAARDRQQAELTTHQLVLAQRGRIPARPPIDEYFGALSAMATQHQLRILRHQPLSPRRYPGLLEQRFAYDVTGTVNDLIRFLKAIEDSSYWADISYLKIERGPGADQAAARNRTAQFTISLFSAPPSEPPTPSGGP